MCWITSSVLVGGASLGVCGTLSDAVGSFEVVLLAVLEAAKRRNA